MTQTAPKPYPTISTFPKTAESVKRGKAHAKQEAIDSGMPEEIAEKMVVGMMREYLDSVVLLRQPFINDDKQQVQDVLPKGVTICSGRCRFFIEDSFPAQSRGLEPVSCSTSSATFWKM